MQTSLTKTETEDLSNLPDKQWQKVRKNHVASPPYNLSDREKALKEAYEKIIQFSLPVWLTGGSLLGAIRDHDFIPWDDDVDMDMRASDLIKIIKELKNKLMECGFIVRAKKNLPFPKLSFFKYGQKISIGGLHDQGDFLTRPHYKYPTKFFSTKERIVFKGCEFHVPSPPEEYLAFVYGNDWRTPKKSDNELEYINPINFITLPRFVTIKRFILSVINFIKR